MAFSDFASSSLIKTGSLRVHESNVVDANERHLAHFLRVSSDLTLNSRKNLPVIKFKGSLEEKFTLKTGFTLHLQLSLIPLDLTEITEPRQILELHQWQSTGNCVLGHVDSCLRGFEEI